MQELHTSRACSLPFQEACLLWKCFVNDWSEVMAEARPGPDDALRLQVRFCMLFKCVLCSAPNPDHALSCRHASACFQAHAVPLAASVACTAAPRCFRCCQLCPGHAAATAIERHQSRWRLLALCSLSGGRGYPIARHSLGGPPRVTRHLCPPDPDSMLLAGGHHHLQPVADGAGLRQPHPAAATAGAAAGCCRPGSARPGRARCAHV